MTPKHEDGKAQPSIHSFFKRKTPPPTSPTKNIENDDPIIDLTGSPPSKKPKVLSSPKQFLTHKNSLTQSKSSYFAKPARTPSTSVTPAPAQGNSTTTSTNLEIYRASKPHTRPALQSGTAFDVYSVNSEAGPSTSQSQSVRSEDQRRKHEAWQKRILSNGGIIRRRRSLALDEAAAAELRGEAGVDTPDIESALNTPAAEVENPLPMEIDSEDENRKKLAQGVGSKLAAKYASKVNNDTTTKTGRDKGKKKEEIGPSGQTYTPLEKQFMEVKEKNQDVLLLMEVGYRYKFHGDDAKTAARELGIVSFPSRNFYVASIPTHRLHIHVKKLISLGYKVGVISQTETAALKKAGENRNAPFTRELTHLFTAATYVEDPSLPSSSTLLDDPIIPGSAPPPTNALVAVVEQGLGGMVYDERVRIALVSVVPGTGEVVWDEFDDSQVRSELETRLTHLQPAELLLPKDGLSKATEKVLSHFTSGTSGTNAAVRTERISTTRSYDQAFDYLSEFYGGKPRPKRKAKTKRKDTGQIDLTFSDEEMAEPERTEDSENFEEPARHTAETNQTTEENDIGLATGLDSAEAILALVDFPKQVVIALCTAIQYMKTFGLQDAFKHRSSFAKFINRAHMLLSSNTLVNLEIYRNQDDGGIYGSLLWLLDHCKTRMGRRLLREWIGRPLLDIAALRTRTDAIEEIMENNTYYMEKLRSLLVNMPDLVKGLTRIQYCKAMPTEMATILVALVRIGSEFKPTNEPIFKSNLLNNILQTLPTIQGIAKGFLDSINLKAARDNEESNLWNDPDKYPDIQDAKDCINICESELDQHLKDIRKTLKRPTLNFVTVAGIEFLVEVPVRDAKSVPAKWIKISATKSVNRYHTPEVLRINKEREQHKETLNAVSREAFKSFQSDISDHHELVVVSKQIAVIDCLMSLAQVAAASGYCKPKFVKEPELRIKAGRHPMVEMLRDDAYVPFDIDFSERDGTSKVITGPNMAGKSSCVRAVALIVCMAQIGSFVPATSVTLGVHDAVQTRMGASDEIGRGKSTFMVELSETSDILRTMTPRTLVILDELGRGTSTYDGVAIAYATLSHVAGKGCNTLFVTHYPMVAEQLAREKPNQISNWHMAFDEIKLPDGSAEITFLYKLTKGLAEASFGVWCARLAGLPKSILENAQLRADYLKHETQLRLVSALTKRTGRMLNDIQDKGEDKTEGILRNINILDRGLRMITTDTSNAHGV
ncbi:uncharacterized protein L201_002726 [Kwoniella dendrophila CBS 6074]|uniref:DNA mismatch repair protein MSH3 n=1 Tax=Kwoniella dendrophila CBS 6074 TaxID=1295534 RepID=A0AAX4JSE2_9TREE